MIQIQAKVRGFLCTTAHPVGCQQNIEHQIRQAQTIASRKGESRPKNVLIIGGSAGYGLASRIVCAAGYGANTLSIALEKPPKENKTASAGWYNDFYFQRWAKQSGIAAKSISGDAFSLEIKQQAVDTIKADMGKIDLVIYSLAAPRRNKLSPDKEPVTHQSVIKPINRAIQGQTIDTATGVLKPFELEPASQQEIDDTVSVMGGEDWYDLMNFLNESAVLSEQCKTVAFSYLGGDLTKSIYGAGTLGAAKENLEYYCQKINDHLLPSSHSARANVAVLKAIVTQSSAAIPSLPLYISLLYRVMKNRGNHEGCMEQIIRLFDTGLYPLKLQTCKRDKPYRFRLDDRELNPVIQHEVSELWKSVSNENLSSISDLEGYRSDFLSLFGFGWPEVDYEQPVSTLPTLADH